MRARFPQALAAIAATGFVGRVVYVVCMRNKPVGGDGPFYHYGALFLVRGHGFVNPLVRLYGGGDVPSALHPPAWTIVLALPSALGQQSYLAHQLVATVVGTLTIVVTGLAGRAAFGARTGLIAAAILAVYPNTWIYEREVEAETLVLLGVAVTIWIVYRYHDRPSRNGAIALGVAVGVLALTRAELVALIIILVVPLILSTASVSWGTKVARLAIVAAVCGLVISPWAIYNSTRFERNVPLSTGFGSAMLQGNCPPTYSGPLLGSFKLGCAILAKGASKDPSVADGQNRHLALDYMRAHSSWVPVVVAARIGRTFGLYRPFQELHLARDRLSPLWVLRLGLLGYWILLPLAIVGGFVARRRRVLLYPVLVFPVTVLIAVIPTIGEIRYRASAEIPLVLLAAVAIDWGLDRWGPRTESAVDRVAKVAA